MKAVLYHRFSPQPETPRGKRAGQRSELEADSCDKQSERCHAFCEAFGYEVTTEYRDEFASGGSTEGRPMLGLAITEAKRLKAVLVCYDMSRLARNVEDALRIDRELRKSGAALCFVVERIDTSCAEGRLMFTIFAAFAAYQRQVGAERTKKAMLHHQANGRRMSKEPPYGWEVQGGELAENAFEQRIIGIIKTGASLGMSAGQIATDLSTNGWKPRSGKIWQRNTIARILRRAANDKHAPTGV